MSVSGFVSVRAFPQQEFLMKSGGQYSGVNTGAVLVSTVA